MRISLKSLFAPVLSVSLLAGNSDGAKAPRTEMLGFPGSTVDVLFTNPDPSSWGPFDLGNDPRPDMLNKTLRHKGIRDTKGINIRPVMSITAWKFPDDGMNLKDFSDFLLNRNPIKETSRVLKDGRLYIQGTVFYGGVTHIISRALSYQNRVGIDLICDSTDSIYPKVKDAFDGWCEAARFAPRITPTLVQLPDLPNQGGKDDAVVARRRFLEKQVPGGTVTGDITGIRDESGMVVFWNRSSPYFRLKVEGNKFAGYGEDVAMFTVDGAVLQIQSTEQSEFLQNNSGRDAESILIAHRDWEFYYLQEVSGVKHSLQSWAGKLPDGSPVLYWDATPEKAAVGEVKRRLYCTRYHEGSVITVSSVESKDVSLEQAKDLIFFAISNIDFSAQRFDIKKIQSQMAQTKP